MFDAIAARLPRVLKIEGPVHGEIAADSNATIQAIVITAVAALVASLTGEGGFATRIIGAVILAPIGLFIWTGIAFVLGKMFGGTADYISLARPMGYSAAPYALAIVPVVGQLAGTIYSAIIQVKLHQEVNGLSQGSAIAVVAIPLVALLVIGFILTLLGLALLAGLGDLGS